MVDCFPYFTKRFARLIGLLNCCVSQDSRFKMFMPCINCCKLKTGDIQIMLMWVGYFIKPFINDRLLQLH